MNWFLLTIIAIFFRALYGLMTKVLSNRLKVSAYTHSVLLTLIAALITLLISPIVGGLSLNLYEVKWWILILMVVSAGVGNVTYFIAIKNLTNGTAQIAFSSILLFNTILAVLLLDLNLSVINFIGIVVLMLAIISVVSGKIEFHKQGIILMVLSAFCFSLFQLSSSQLASQLNAVTYLFLSNLGAGSAVLLYKWQDIYTDLHRVSNEKNSYLIPLFTALPSLGYALFSYYAYRSAPVPAKVAMLLPAQVVVTVILSYYWLNEKSHIMRKTLAAIGVIISSVFIKI